LMNRGVYCGAKGFLLVALSTPMDDAVANTLINTFKEALTVVATLAS